MTADDAKLAGAIVQALEDLDYLTEQLKQRVPPDNYDRRAMTIAIENMCDSGSTADGSIEISLELADRMVPAVKDWLLIELHKLGVSPP